MNDARRACAACFPLLMYLGCGSVRADDLDPLMSALRATQPLVDLRVRSDTSTQTGFSRDSQALLLRARLGLRSGSLWDTALLAEASLLTPLVSDYNSGLNGKPKLTIASARSSRSRSAMRRTDAAGACWRRRCLRLRSVGPEHRGLGREGLSDQDCGW